MNTGAIRQRLQSELDGFYAPQSKQLRAYWTRNQCRQHMQDVAGYKSSILVWMWIKIAMPIVAELILEFAEKLFVRIQEGR